MDTNTGFNNMLNNLHNELADTIKKSGLPIGIVYYIVKDVFNELTQSYKETLLLEMNQPNDEENKEE